MSTGTAGLGCRADEPVGPSAAAGVGLGAVVGLLAAGVDLLLVGLLRHGVRLPVALQRRRRAGSSTLPGGAAVDPGEQVVDRRGVDHARGADAQRGDLVASVAL